MEHFVDMLLNRKFDLNKEVLAIEALIHRSEYNTSIFREFSSHFLDWRLRNNFIDVDIFLRVMGITTIVRTCYGHTNITIEEYLYYCEYVLNMLNLIEGAMLGSILYARENVFNVLEQLNYTTHESNGIIHIIENDVLVSEASDIVQGNYDLGEGIYSFNYRENKGDIIKKADILCRIYKHIENITPKCKEYGYSGMLDDIKDLMNKLDIRHAATSKQSKVIEGMGNDEYESWLDQLFRTSLSLILLTDYADKRKDIKELKAKLG